MRLLLALLALAVSAAGCLESATPAADAASRLEAASPEDGPLQLGEMSFVLGPIGQSPASDVSAFMEVGVPEGFSKVVVVLSFSDGATVDFVLDGIPGCEHGLAGPNHVAGFERSFECAPPAGDYALRMSHASGHAQGHVLVTAWP